MRHLTDDQLVDLAEGVVLESDVPHVAACAACRQQLAELGAALTIAAEATVPEPSPLFWDHFSSRVRDAVASGAGTRESWWRRVSWWPGIMAPISALVAAILVLAVVFRTPGPTSQPAPAVEVELLNDASEDPSLALVAELTDALEPDAAVDADLAGEGSADHAVTHLNDDELRELQRLLKDALARRGV